MRSEEVCALVGRVVAVDAGCVSWGVLQAALDDVRRLRGYNRTKLHHINWWRHGGLTDLDNMLPLCERHHHKIHNNGWTITLGTNRELTLTLPDGQIMTTGPPNRHAA